MRQLSQTSTRHGHAGMHPGPTAPRSAQAGALAPARMPHHTPRTCSWIARAEGSSPTPAMQVPPQYAPAQDAEMATFQKHQSKAVRPTPAEDVRTIVQLAPYGLLSTLCSTGETRGSPVGSVVEFAADASGQPLLSLSTLSSHTRDLQEDGRCSLTVMAPGFRGLQDGRCTLTGVAQPLGDDADKAAVREAYLARHPHAFYVDFGDFLWFRVAGLKPVRYNGGFGRAATIAAAEYCAARPDPVSAFSAPVCQHMNADHEGDLLAMVAHYSGLRAATAQMLGLDRLGCDLLCSKEGNAAPIKVRLPFPSPAEGRKGVKEALVEMTKAARAGAAQA